MCGFEAEGSAAIVQGKVIESPSTVATAIRIGNPASWKEAEAAARDSHGEIGFVSDEEILKAYRLIAQTEGIFCEPSSAASLAGLVKNIGLGKVPSQATVVSVLTGNGLKDPDTAMKISSVNLTPLPPTLEKLREVMNS
jgi:threonine synthase